MTVDVNRMAQLAPRREVLVAPEERGPSQRPPIGRYTRSASRWLWKQLVNAISGPGLEGGGIDESAFPSGFSSPHKKGSRQVRNLWHEPF